jgi:hypothetical protein
LTFQQETARHKSHEESYFYARAMFIPHKGKPLNVPNHKKASLYGYLMHSGVFGTNE